MRVGLAHEGFRFLAVTVYEIQPGDRQTDRQQSLSKRVPFLPFGYGTLINMNFQTFKSLYEQQCKLLHQNMLTQNIIMKLHLTQNNELFMTDTALTPVTTLWPVMQF